MVNIGDVAKRVGVSRSTVSYALSGKRPVSAPMQERIEKAIRELDYWPSAAGQALANSRSNILALLAPMAENAAPAVALQFINGIVQASRRLGFDTLLITGEEAFEGVERVVRANLADGLVVLDVEEGDRRLDSLAGARVPAVLVGQPSGVPALDHVDLDWTGAGRLFVRHLAELGHRDILVLGPPRAADEMGMTYAVRFRSGVREEAGRCGARIFEIAISNDFTASVAAITTALHSHPGVTGVIVQNEAAAGPLVAVANNLGLSVPQNLSVVGVTLDAMDTGFIAPLSGVDNPSVEITGTAVQMLVERIQGARPAPRARIVPVTFADRGTTAQRGPGPANRPSLATPQP